MRDARPKSGRRQATPRGGSSGRLALLALLATLATLATLAALHRSGIGSLQRHGRGTDRSRNLHVAGVEVTSDGRMRGEGSRTWASMKKRLGPGGSAGQSGDMGWPLGYLEPLIGPRRPGKSPARPTVSSAYARRTLGVCCKPPSLPPVRAPSPPGLLKADGYACPRRRRGRPRIGWSDCTRLCWVPVLTVVRACSGKGQLGAGDDRHDDIQRTSNPRAEHKHHETSRS